MGERRGKERRELRERLDLKILKSNFEQFSFYVLFSFL
jgi:hypothetical protein